MKVGFVGVGNMGGPMCRNIIKNTNHEVTVFDLNAESVAACKGAKAGRSLAEVAAGSDVIFTSLPMPRDCEVVAIGPGGIADHARAGTAFIDLSTNSPAVARKLHAAMQAKGIGMLEAPVSGGVPRAIDGTIVIMVGGDAALFEAQRPLLASFSSEVVHVGDVGYGSVAKLINNQLSFSNMAAAAEALMLGRLSGINLEKLDQVIRNASGNSNSYRNVAGKAFRRDFRPGFALDLAHKDLRLALEMADELGMPGMIGPQVMNLLRMARGMGLGSEDNSAMLKVYEAALGREVKP
jgi:3-hydroxyisobutyrate dehydrogenase-like beta-hydroxyacid dehydrogenase